VPSKERLRHDELVGLVKQAGLKERGKPRRRTGGPASEAAASGSQKGALRQFALGAAGGYRGRDACLNFTTHLLECFGWKKGRPEGAEIPCRFAIADGGKRLEREVALWWPQRRVMMEVASQDAVLAVAWKDLLRACLQLAPTPQYIIITNQRDFHLYDLARNREAPRLSIPIDDLPKYSEAFPFFTTQWIPGMTPRIVSVERVSAEVADLVAKFYRSVRAQHTKRERDVIRFTLQCITAMFAEDIGLLPNSYFTSLLYDGAKHGNIERRLHELFVQMNTRDLPEPRIVPYFNGGLFTDAVTLTLGDEQVIALTKAAEADWTYVDPHIFGSVFQGIMNDDERHAQGAHYTAHDDIMRVVGPTIVEPWRRRIEGATSLKELGDLRAELLRSRVLDPACGSGNFLYVSFREMYRLDTELLSRMRDFPSTHSKVSWHGGIQPINFFGLDINPFAVELAKVTLNIAKKIAFEERRAQAEALSGQVEMDVDPSLPLDNLDQNIICADALFTEWPPVNAIVGNPPFLGGSKIRAELGPDYLRKLQGGIGADGIVDLACYWFRRAHDHLAEGARAGLVATSGIRIGKQREASLDYILAKGGTITNAVSSRLWPGDSAVHVSMVNWVRGPVDGPHQLEINDEVFTVSRISAHLQLHSDLGGTRELASNATGMNSGVSFGHEAFRSSSEGFPLAERRTIPSIKPVATADDLLRGKLSIAPDYCIYLTCSTEEEARAKGGVAFEYLSERVLPVMKGRVESGKAAAIHDSWIRRWWQPWAPRTAFFACIAGGSRMLVIPKVSSRPSFAFLSMTFVPNDTLKVFACEDDYSFGILQSNLHWEWTKAKGGKVRRDIQYTGEVWRTFAWPQDPTEQQVAEVAAAGRELRRVRSQLMEQNAWSLRELYQAAEVEGPHPLKDAQAALDGAVREAYGVPADQDRIAFLLELNQLVAEDEELGRKVRGPGLPDHLDSKDARWTSTDCIEPPSMKD
jgi:SAM-dependent methyltransferase